jgi:hypothetical protein
LDVLLRPFIEPFRLFTPVSFVDILLGMITFPIQVPCGENGSAGRSHGTPIGHARPTDDSDITQCDLGNLEEYERAMRRLLEKRDRIAQSVLTRARNGARLEDGPLTYEIKERFEGMTQILELKVW